MKLSLVAGTTSKLVHIFIQNNSVTTGAGLTGLLYSTSGLTWYYLLEGASADVQVTLATATLGTWATGGFVAVDATGMPGVYEISIPNAALTGAKSVKMMLTGAANMSPVLIEIELTGWNNQDAVHGGLSALPSAAAAAAGGLVTIGTGSNQLQPISGGVNVTEVNSDGTAPGNIANAYNGTGYTAPTAPAQQQQVANIGATTAALNQTAASSTYTTGTSTGGYTDTYAIDGVYDSVADAAGTVDFYYQFNISAAFGAVAVGCQWWGYVAGVANTIKVFAYNWGGSSWDQIGTINGIAGTANEEANFDLTSAHTGTGGNAGLVRIRFQNTGLTSSATKTDRILLGYTVVLTPPTNWASMAIDGSGNVSVASLTSMLNRILGLIQNNAVLDGATVGAGPTYDGNGNMTAATVWCYDSAADATTHNGVTGLIGKYSIAATFNGSNELTLYRQEQLV